MKGIKKWSLKYPLGAAGILLAAAGALILYWAFGREQASEDVYKRQVTSCLRDARR